MELEGTVDTDNNMITVLVDHFTTFAVIGAITPPAPATFSVSNLSVIPPEVQPDGVVTISISVANSGGTEGSYSAALKINGVKEAEKSLIIAAGTSQDVSFRVRKADPGNYTISVDGSSGSFTVVAPAPAPPPAAPAPLPEEKEVPEAPTNWTLINVLIAVGLVVVGLLGYFFVWRKRGAPRPS